MPITLYDATVAGFVQHIEQVHRLIDKAEAFCAAEDIAPAELIQARLAPDMLPFAYQVKSVAVHSLGAIEGVRRGWFSPDTSEPPDSFAGLRARVADARAGLAAIDRDEVEGFIGRDVEFRFGERIMPFTAENFLLSFSVPNFHFHATTTYALLRAAGLGLGKIDYLGRVRVKA